MRVDDHSEDAPYLEAVLDSSPNAIYSSTTEGVIRTWNNAAASLYGYSRDEAIGQHLSFLIPSERVGEEGQILDAVRQGRRVESWDTTRVHKSGRRVRVSLTVSPVKDHLGKVIGASAVARNTDQESELTRLDAHRRLRQLMELLPFGVFMVDATGRPTAANARAIAILGRGADPAAGPGDLARVYQAYRVGSDELYPTEELPLVRALKGETSRVDDMELHLDDRTVPLEVWGTPIIDPDGSVTGAVAAFVDIGYRRAQGTPRN